MRRLFYVLLLAAICLMVAAPSPVQNRALLLGGYQGIKYLLRDEFTTDLAAGSVNGTACEPGPGTRTVTDAGGRLSLSGGKAVSTFGGGAWDTPKLAIGTVTRALGQMALFQVNTSSASGGNNLNLGLLSTPGNAQAGITLAGAGTGLYLLYNDTYITNPIATYSDDVDTIYCVIYRTNGFMLLRKVSSENWKLLYIIGIGSGNGVAGFSNYRYIWTSSFIKTPVIPYLPPPLISDGFGGTWPISDGAGHAEVTGLGSGGSGRTWLDAGTWPIAGGLLSNTPVTGAEYVSDPGMDAAGDWTAGAGWSIAGGVATKVLDVASYVVNSSGSAAVVGTWYKMVSSPTVTTGSCGPQIGGNSFYGTSVSAVGMIRIGRALTTAKAQYYGNATFTGTVDDFSVKPLPISTLLTLSNQGTTDVWAEAVIHAFTLGTQCGVAQADRSFAAKCASTAAAGQAVISLKEVTGGQELVTNGGFDSNTTGWSDAGGVSSSVANGYSGNCLKITNSGASYGRTVGAISTQAGGIYTLTFYTKTGTEGLNLVYIGSTSGGSEIASQTYTNSSWTLQSITFTALGATTYIRLGNGHNVDGLYSFYDSVTCKPGLTVTDTLTIAGTTYTIASITGGSNVAYNDTTKTQTVTLGSNLSGEVAADTKVGVNWASWNGVLTYFDGAGNVKLDEVKNGVYTNRLSVATAFAADKQLVVRKIGTEYRVFFNNTLIGTTTAVDAAAQVGTYWGVLSTDVSNTVTSFVTYPTGAGNEYGNLDRYSKLDSGFADSYWQQEVANG